MLYAKFLFSAIVGAIIGYITNWLAIKMLFRPHTEKRIFGIKVPFTPGLIPKEQSRLAKSTGEAIGNHLLTQDTMFDALRNNGLDEKFKRWVEEKAIEIMNSNLTIMEQGIKILGTNFRKFKEYLKSKVTNLLLASIRRNKFKEAVEALILNEIKKELSKSPKVILESSYYKDLKNTLVDRAKDFKTSEEFKGNIEKLIKNKLSELEDMDKALNEVIPDGFIGTIKVYVYSKNHEIAMSIKSMLRDEKTQKKLKSALADLISNNVSSVIAMFLNPETIYSKVLPALEGYLDKEETQKEIALFINELIDKIMQNKLSDVLLSLSEETKNNNAKYLSDVISDRLITDKLIEDITAFLEGKFNQEETLEEVFKKANINLENIVVDYMGRKIDYMVNSKEIEEKIVEHTNNAIEKLFNLNISDLSRGKEEKISRISSNIAEDIFERFLNTRAKEFIGAFDISKIVEEKISSFEVSFAEKLILEISSRELNAITWLGALLGFIMGLGSSIIAAI
ncbi:hypothetical protein CLHOM_26800 [Clostridium homopropionicum DSM 5847]|uniref:DUF445 domain-containing protein n=1 Tax=Clostridium homopropionicum DSM 5847 TaxID=1121318 RepID=A0A0L6Z7J5_9CLOT|nr:DUF445 family protein [Clostridium homopropionicum]KOA18940.1 hypothetical protein CLHOM_26800 [Clostridium homopropionicum DSM 5847]SFG43888.1 Uncharacterized membrane protein YheB, UPF0754 family [Clostridium homopropionicum]